MENRVWMAEMNPTMRTKPTPDYSEREQALSGRHASAIRSKSSFTIARVLWQTRNRFYSRGGWKGLADVA
jgi:hypothetical protein